jgi:very-short-patch-repair endonuclease
VWPVDGNNSHQLATPDVAIARVAGRQHGMVARWQLVAAGLDGDAIAYRVRAGRLHPRHRGVYAVGHVPVSPLATAMAAVLACGEDAVLSHRSAAALWRILPRWPHPVEVTARAGRTLRGIHVHRSRTLTRDDVTRHHGIPVTTPERTLLDVTETLPDRELARAENEAYVQKLTTPPALAVFLTRNPGRPTSRLTHERSATAAPTRSHLEDDFLRFLRRHRLPIPELNQRIAGYEVDAVWRDRRLIVELDGYAYHATPQAFERDRERDATFLTAGFSTLRITRRRLTEREAARLRRLLS